LANSTNSSHYFQNGTVTITSPVGKIPRKQVQVAQQNTEVKLKSILKSCFDQKYLFHKKYSRIQIENYWLNPQFLLVITDQDIPAHGTFATVIISLLQRTPRTKEHHIQFRIHRITCKKALLKCFQSGEPLKGDCLERIGSSGNYINLREVTRRFALIPGEYIVTASTFKEGDEAEFLLRFFSERPLNGTRWEDLKKEHELKLRVCYLVFY